MAKAVDAGARPPGPPGWVVVARKEFADHAHSIRLVILAALLGLAAVAAVFSASGTIRQISEQTTTFQGLTGLISGEPGLFLRLFSVTDEASRLPPFASFIALLGPLLGIAFGFDAVNGERAQGTLPRLLSQPIYRDDVVNGKFVAGLAAIGTVLVALVMLLSAVGMWRLGIVPSPADVIRIVVWLFTSLAYIGFWLAVAMLFSVLLRRAATSALASIAAWLVMTLFAFLLVGLVADVLAPMRPDATQEEALRNAQMQQTLSRLSPGTLYEESSSALLNPHQRAVGIVFRSQLEGALPNPISLEQSLLIVWPQVIGLIALTILTFAATYMAFMRQEVRA